MHLPPSSWGPFFWHTMHIVALGYPVKATYGHKKAAKDFFESLTFLIPCPICRDHYAEFLQKMPISPFLDRRDDLFKWTVELHNNVNETLGKPKYSEVESINFYARLGASGRSPVLKPDDFAEADLRAIIKGIGLGVATTVTIGGLLWWFQKGEKQ
jgi:Erv1 / Alr family